MLYYDTVTSTFPPNDWIPTANAYHLSDGASVLNEGVGSNYGLFETVGLAGSGQPWLTGYCRGGSPCPLSTNVENQKNDKNITVFPMPFNDWITVRTSEDFEFNFRLFSVDGILIEEDKSITNNKIPFAVNKGIYFLEIINPDKNIYITKKIIKSF